MSKFIDSLPYSGFNGVTWRECSNGVSGISRGEMGYPLGLSYWRGNLKRELTRGNLEFYKLRAQGTVTEIQATLTRAIRELQTELFSRGYPDIHTHLEFFEEAPVPEEIGDQHTIYVFIGAFVREIKSTYLQQLRQHLGLCPECGESSRLDPCGGACCTKHGFYPLVIVPHPGEAPKPVELKDWIVPT